ncbi:MULTISPECIES: hypothetical protein [Rhizobium]|uniref:hypothetical protein n=1 Tax=Rhizobium TaxID=379 RepID=UPI001FE1E716|nr:MULTISPECIES: hypothetical protein [Rhizobium]
MREKNVALDCLLARQPRHFLTLKNVEKSFLEPSGADVGNAEKWKQSRREAKLLGGLDLNPHRR